MKAKHLCLAWALLWTAAACGQEVKMVEVEPMNISFTRLTQNETVKPKALEMHGAEIPGVSFTYTSENSAVATVDSGGIVRPTGNGSTAIVARAPNGVKGEAFIKVCLPKEMKCFPENRLDLKVGVAAPIKCEVTNCRDEMIPAKFDLNPVDSSVVLKEGENVFIGLKVGDTRVSVKAFDFETTVAVKVEEQDYLPGMGPGSISTGSRKKGAGVKGSSDPYGSGGRFDHILKNMKVSTD